MKVIQAASIGRLHELAVEFVAKNGHEVITEDEEYTLETEPITLVCKTPFDEYRISDKSSIKRGLMDEYARYLLEGYGCSVKFEYSYFERLQEYREHLEDESLNQITYICDKLREQPTSRRALGITWQPDKDCFRKDVPCLQFIQAHIVENKLDFSVVFRSNDILLASGSNMYALTMLQKHIADRLGIETGKYEHTAIIPHIYHKRDENELGKFVREL